MIVLFPLGQVGASPEHWQRSKKAKQQTSCFLTPHATGDWETLDRADVAEIDYKIVQGFGLP